MLGDAIASKKVENLKCKTQLHKVEDNFGRASLSASGRRLAWSFMLLKKREEIFKCLKVEGSLGSVVPDLPLSAPGQHGSAVHPVAATF